MNKVKIIAFIIITFAICGVQQSMAVERGGEERVGIVCTDPFQVSEDESLTLSMFLSSEASTMAGRATVEIIGSEGVVTSEDFEVLPGIVTTISLALPERNGLTGFVVGCVKSKGGLGKLLGKLGEQVTGILGKLSGNFSKKSVGGVFDKIGLGCSCSCCCR
jgi:hypothetical protein